MSSILQALSLLCGLCFLNNTVFQKLGRFAVFMVCNSVAFALPGSPVLIISEVDTYACDVAPQNIPPIYATESYSKDGEWSFEWEFPEALNYPLLSIANHGLVRITEIDPNGASSTFGIGFDVFNSIGEVSYAPPIPSLPNDIEFSIDNENAYFAVKNRTLFGTYQYSFSYNIYDDAIYGPYCSATANDVAIQNKGLFDPSFSLTRHTADTGYTLAWSPSYNSNDYKLLLGSMRYDEFDNERGVVWKVVQTGGDSYTVNEQKAGAYQYKLVTLNSLVASSMVFPTYDEESIIKAVPQLTAPHMVAPTQSVTGDYTVAARSPNVLNSDMDFEYLQSDGSWAALQPTRFNVVTGYEEWDFTNKSQGSYHYQAVANYPECQTITAMLQAMQDELIGNQGACSHENISTQKSIAVNRIGPGFYVDNGLLSWNANEEAPYYVIQKQQSDGSWSIVYTGNNTSFSTLPGSNYKIKSCESLNESMQGINCGEYSTEWMFNFAGGTPNPAPFFMPPHDVSVGAIGGQHQVGQDGSANYTIPLTLPVGRAGIQPELAITYNSNAGNGLLGMGWSLSGLSAIYRCPTTLERDGEIHGVDFGSDDQFCFDGQRLVAVNALPNEQAPTGMSQIYTLESENYSRVYGIGTVGTGHDYFVVKTREGKELTFGDTVDSKVEANGPNAAEIMTWAINRVEDSYGNYMVFNYEEDSGNGDHRINDIRYTGKAGVVSPSYKVEFEYSDRTDTQRGYFAESWSQQLKKLDRIVATSGSFENVVYNFNYLPLTTSDLTKLDSVQQCNAGQCLKPTTIEWSLDEYQFDILPLSTATPWGSEQFTWLADFNGDGLSDIATAISGNVYMKLSTGTGLTSQTWDVLPSWGTGDNTWVGDFNGDGLSDIASASGSQVHMKLSEGDSFDSVPWDVTADWGAGNYTWAGDFNGDGLSDIASALGDKVYMKLSEGDGFDSVPWDVDADWGTAGNTWVGDFNGDGLSDIASASGNQVHMKLSTGTGFDSISWPVENTWNQIGFNWVGDFNGDGLADIASATAGSVHIKLSTGAGFTSVSWPTEHTWNQFGYYSAADINGDGLTDIVGAQLNISTGSGFNYESWPSLPPGPTYYNPYSPPWSLGDKRFIRLGDFTGDGSLDFVSLFGEGQSIHVRSNSAANVNTVQSITNGMGISTDFFYKPLTDNTVYSKDSALVYPINEVQPAQYVVQKATISNGLGGEFTTSYSYEGLQVHLKGLGSLGFSSMVTLNEDTGIATKTTYNQDYKARTEGSIESIETVAGGSNDLSLSHSNWAAWKAGGNVTSLTVNEWQTFVEMDGESIRHKVGEAAFTESDYKICKTSFTTGECNSRRYHRQLTKTTITKNDLNGAFLNKEVNDYTYDDFDSPLTILTSLQNEGGTEVRNKLTTNEYFDNGANIADWLIGQVENTVVKVKLTGIANSEIIRKSGWEYYSITGRKKAEIIFDGDTVNEISRTEYLDLDGFGNHETTQVSGADFVTRESTVVYDSTGSYVKEARNALLQKVSSTYYPSSHINAGKVNITTDINNIKTKYIYDAFGRTVQTISAYSTANPVSSFTAFQWCDNISDSMPCENKIDPDTGVVAKPVYRITNYTEGGTGSHVYIDQLGREVKRASQAVDGRFVIVGNGYDARGHNTRVCEPFYQGEPEYVTKIEYDALGRIVKAYSPFPSSANATSTVYRLDTIAYNGLIRTSTNDVGGSSLHSGQKKIQTRNEMGSLIKVVDNAETEVTYDYNAVGNMTKVTAPDVIAPNLDGSSLGADHNITIINYDALGRKTFMDDPDKGLWDYAYNGLGQLLTQTNANLIASCTVYDLLGRKIRRYDNYAGTDTDAVNQCANAGSNTKVTQWDYDHGARGKGKLWMAASYDASSAVTYQSEIIYDFYSRPASNIVTINGTDSYQTDTSYDSLHRPVTMTYPGDNPSDRLKVENIYNTLGFTVALRNAANHDMYYQLLETDAYGNVSKERYGNGVTTYRDFDARTNRLNTIKSYTLLNTTGTPDIQNLAVEFDAIGNLKTRSDNIQNIHERFDYDNLNRLQEMYLNMGNGEVQTSVSYDALGNILSKTGVGTYTYGGFCNGVQAGPHAVTNVTAPKATSYCYDKNGNMLSGDGKTISYSHFDKPTLISKNDGSYQTQIKYGPSRGRYQRVDTNAQSEQTTYTYMGAYEKVQYHNSGKVEERHYVGGFAIITKETVNSVTTEKHRYLHKDHLGSITVITDKYGAIEEEFSFDPWGKRRAANLLELENKIDMPFDSMDNFQQKNLTLSALGLSSSITNKGFTGHEQMDGVGLIHMGGRVYDAELGRFLSADPFIQDRTDSQNLNRYTYVNNNPLSYTDPSGYFSASSFHKKLKKAHKAHFKLAHGYYAHHAAWDNVAKPILKAIGKVEGLATVISVVLNVIPVCAAWCSMVFNAAMASANGASIGDIATGAAVAWVTGVVASGISSAVGSAAGVTTEAMTAVAKGTAGATAGAIAANAAGSAIASGIAAKAQGGKFIDGVKYGGLSAAATLTIRHMQLGDFKATSGCPINLATGEKYLTLSDLQTIGNSRLKFERHYSSFNNEKSALGYGWRHNFNRKLELVGLPDAPQKIIVQRANGDPILFNNIMGESYQTLSDKGYVLASIESVEGAESNARWQLITPDNIIERYDSNGLLVTVDYLGGYQQQLQYETHARLRSGAKRRLLNVIDSLGYTLNFNYNVLGQLLAVTDQGNQAVYFDYDFNNNLIAARYPDATPNDLTDNPTKRYTYSDDRFPHSITGMFNEQGERVHYMAYDPRGRATLSALGNQAGRNRIVFHNRNAEGLRTSTVSNALGRETTYSFNKHNQPITVEGHATASCIAANQGYDYDEKGRVISELDWNGTATNFEYNSRGLEVARTEAAGTAQERIIRTQWHSRLRLPITIIEPGKTTHFKYNSNGLLVKRSVKDTLSKRNVIAKLFKHYPTRVWQYSYNNQGLVVAINGPLKGQADTVHYAYNDQGQRVQVKNALGHTANTLAFNQQGLPTRVIDANGVESTLRYNARGWLTEQTMHTKLASPQGDATTRYTYTGTRVYNGGGSSQANEGLVATVTLPNGNKLSYEYDSAGRRMATSNTEGERIEYQYDLAGNRTHATTLSKHGDIVREQRHAFDKLSRLLQVVGADQAITSYRYDANSNRVGQVDPLGHETTFAFDALNRLVRTTDAAQGIIEQQWDAQDRLTAFTDQRGLTTQYRYNGFGDKVAQISPDTGETQFEHDKAGNVIAKRDARGVKTQYHYDVLNRLAAVNYQGEDQDIAYSYDQRIDQADNEPFNATSLHLIGRLAKVTDASGSTEYRYNALGQLVEEAKQLGTQRYLTAYQYDLAGNLLETRYPTGQVVAYQRDDLGRVTRMAANGTAVVSNLRYDAFAGVNAMQYGNGSMLNIGRDYDGRVSRMQVSSAANDSVYNRIYDYDLGSNIVAIRDAVNAESSQQFSYDALSRLTQAQGSYGQLGYAYDGVGNRVEKTQRLSSLVINKGAAPDKPSTEVIERYRYAQNSNRLLGVNQGDEQRSLAYDALGNIVTDVNTTTQKQLVYGVNNRLQHVDTGSGFAEYSYNAKGQRVIKRLFDGKGDLASEMHYHYNIADQLIAETNGDGTLVKDYLYLGFERLAVVDYNLAEQGELFYVHNDHLGAPQLMTDKDQTIVWQVDRKPFGEVDTRVAMLDMRAGFPGQYADEAGYVYNYFRDYDPSLGRYLQSDPIGLQGGVNTFGYVSGNPVGRVDLYGLDWFMPRDHDYKVGSTNTWIPEGKGLGKAIDLYVPAGHTFGSMHDAFQNGGGFWSWRNVPTMPYFYVKAVVFETLDSVGFKGFNHLKAHDDASNAPLNTNSADDVPKSNAPRNANSPNVCN